MYLGLGAATFAGGVQVSAVNAAVAAKCGLQHWTPMASGQSFQVRCYDATINPLSTGWTLTYQLGWAVTGNRPLFFGYRYDNQPGNPAPTPRPTSSSAMSPATRPREPTSTSSP